MKEENVREKERVSPEGKIERGEVRKRIKTRKKMKRVEKAEKGLCKRRKRAQRERRKRKTTNQKIRK